MKKEKGKAKGHPVLLKILKTVQKNALRTGRWRLHTPEKAPVGVLGIMRTEEHRTEVSLVVTAEPSGDAANDIVRIQRTIEMLGGTETRMTPEAAAHLDIQAPAAKGGDRPDPPDTLH